MNMDIILAILKWIKHKYLRSFLDIFSKYYRYIYRKFKPVISMYQNYKIWFKKWIIWNLNLKLLIWKYL